MEYKPLSLTEISLHWLVALGMIALIGLGLYMSENQIFALYSIHKSIGVLLFVIILIRAFTRLQKGWLQSISKGKPWERNIAYVIHWVLILGTIIMPLSGIIDAVMAGRGLFVFGVELIGANTGTSGRPEAISETASNLSSTIHGVMGKLLIAAILLHLAGALKHHMIDRDSTLRRMLGRS